MFRFLELSLHGWDLWPPVRVPLASDVVVVTGPNGSGKTTLLDAVRQLLNAKGLSSRRRVQNYLRRPDAQALLRAVVSNEAADGSAQPFRAERITTPEATLACVLLPGSGGAPEKRFAILPGRAAVEEVRSVLLESRSWYSPEQYTRALETAGVSRSLMGILAIEQGKTNTLFERKPRDLFREVLDMLGDRAILERYRQARARYEDTQREVAEQTRGLLARRAELERVRADVTRLEEWERARDRVGELERRLPATQLQSLLKRQKDLAPIVTGLRTKISRGDGEKEFLAERLQRARGQEQIVQDQLTAAQAAEEGAQTLHDAASRAQALAQERVTELETKKAAASGMPAADLPILEAAHREAWRERALADEAVALARVRYEKLVAKVDLLAAGRQVYPEAIARTVTALEAAGIEVTVLASTVEIADETLAAAVEAALGDARFALLVAPGDRDLAREVARREGAPGPVYCDERVEARTRSGPLALEAGAPAWIAAWLDEITLREDGSWEDARGAWLRAAPDRALGEHGRRVALAAAERDRDEAATSFTASEEDARRATRRSEAAEAALTTERRRQELLAQVANLTGARAELSRAEHALEAARGSLREAVSNRQRLTTDLQGATVACRDLQRDLGDLETRLAGDRRGLDDAEAEARDCEARISGLSAIVDPELRLRAERGDLHEGEDSVRAELERARTAFERLSAPPPAEIREEARHLADNVDELDRHLSARRQEAENAEAELAECRQRYLAIVAGALEDYRRRARELAERAQVILEMELPRLAALEGDRGLDDAEIRPSFGFDGKEPLPLGDPSFSGGQQVIAGLILLMAMAETERRGFFILDEPFAHLSLDRVDQVGRFLRSTHSQFIITAPTTLDRAQLDPASMVVVLRKKHPDEQFAPIPIVAQA